MTKHDDDAADPIERKRAAEGKSGLQLLKLYRDWLAEADRENAELREENRQLRERLTRHPEPPRPGKRK